MLPLRTLPGAAMGCHLCCVSCCLSDVLGLLAEPSTLNKPTHSLTHSLTRSLAHSLTHCPIALFEVYVHDAEKNLEVLKDFLPRLPANTHLSFVGGGPHMHPLQTHFKGCPVTFTVCG